MQTTPIQEKDTQLLEDTLAILAEYGYPSIVLNGERTGAGRAWWTEYLSHPSVDLNAVADAVVALLLSGELAVDAEATPSPSGQAEWDEATCTVLALGEALGYPAFVAELDGVSYHFPEGELGWHACVQTALAPSALQMLAEDAEFLQTLLRDLSHEEQLQRSWCWFTARRLGFPAVCGVESRAEAWQAFLLLADEDTLAHAISALCRLRGADPALSLVPSDLIPWGVVERTLLMRIAELQSDAVKAKLAQSLGMPAYEKDAFYRATADPECFGYAFWLLARLGTNGWLYDLSVLPTPPPLHSVFWQGAALMLAEKLGYPEIREERVQIAKGYIPWTHTLRYTERWLAREYVNALLRRLMENDPWLQYR